jgi:hypothetical protein
MADRPESDRVNAVLLWALPGNWLQFELLGSELSRRVEAEMRERFRDAGVDERELDRLIAMQVETLRGFAQDGIVLLATRAGRSARDQWPPSGLTLTLALANRPAPEEAGDKDSSEREETGSHKGQRMAFASEATPLLLEDPKMIAFTREARTEVSVPDADTTLRQFQAQAFVLPEDELGMAVITVATFDPTLEDEARQAARNFADTLCLVTADGDQEMSDVGGRE